MCGQQPDGGAARAALGQGVGRDLLGDEGGQEGADADVVAALLGAGRDVEQGAHGVEVTMGAPGRTTAGVDRPAQPLRPLRARPEDPQHLLGRGSGRELLARVEEQPGQRADSAHLGPVQAVEEPGFDDGSPDQVAGRAGRAVLGLAGDLLACAQQASEAAYVSGVQPSQRPQQQRLGAGGVDVVDVLQVGVVEVDDRPERVDQRDHGRVAHERHLVVRHLDRDSRGAECPPQGRDRRPPRPDEHGHVVPRDAVLQVGAAEQVGEVLRLGPLGVEGADDHASLAQVSRVGDRLEERPLGCLGDRAGQREPTRDPLRGDEQTRAEPTRGPQRDHLGRGAAGLGELGREVEDSAHVGTAEAVDRLVRVADHGQVAAVAGDRLEKGDLTGVGVLVLVDEHVAEPGAQLVAVGLGLDRGATDQVGVVGGPLAVEVGEVLVEEQAGGNELGHVVGLAEGAQCGPVEPLLAGAGQHGVHLAREAAGAERPVEGDRPPHRLRGVTQQLAEHDVLLGRAQQPQRGFVEVGRGVAADQAVGEGVEGRAERGGHGAADPGGDPVAQLLGRLPGERQRQHLVGAGAADLDPLGDRLDQGRGLAGARPGQDEQGATGVVDHALLVLVERRRCRGRGGRHEAVRRRGHVAIRPSASDSPQEASR